MPWLFILLTCGMLVGADRWLKTLALNGVTHDFGFGQFILFKNASLVFSWPAPNMTAIWLMVIAIVIVLYVTSRMSKEGNFVGIFGCLLMLSGAGSNLYDRFTHGFVIDWAYLGRWWPVFNLADVLIAVGLVMLIFFRPRFRPDSGIDKKIPVP